MINNFYLEVIKNSQSLTRKQPNLKPRNTDTSPEIWLVNKHMKKCSTSLDISGSANVNNFETSLHTLKNGQNSKD